MPHDAAVLAIIGNSGLRVSATGVWTEIKYLLDTTARLTNELCSGRDTLAKYRVLKCTYVSKLVKNVFDNSSSLTIKFNGYTSRGDIPLSHEGSIYGVARFVG